MSNLLLHFSLHIILSRINLFLADRGDKRWWLEGCEKEEVYDGAAAEASSSSSSSGQSGNQKASRRHAALPCPCLGPVPLPCYPSLPRGPVMVPQVRQVWLGRARCRVEDVCVCVSVYGSPPRARQQLSDFVLPLI